MKQDRILKLLTALLSLAIAAWVLAVVEAIL